ncbi:MAG TPA: ADP-ribosylation factor-like protein [Kofleriaceae bacterium]|nr:ADP-ribosylation factor-like protein [Kofleriaceae bacterium]
MPYVDRRTNSVVLRIVYEGPPEAGKATNLEKLCERLSLRQPSHADQVHERGMVLDWLDAEGEAVGGPRVRCQLVNVPRQLQLARCGRTLLDSADAVVFVADSRASAAPRTKAALRSLVRGLGNRSDVPLVLQANKQDLPGAQPPSDLHHALGLAARVPVIAAHAAGGEGVVETFTLAVRVAVDHVRARLVAGELGEGDATNGNELLSLDAIPEIFDELDAVTTAAAAATRRIVAHDHPPPPARSAPRAQLAPIGWSTPRQGGLATERTARCEAASSEWTETLEEVIAPERMATQIGIIAPERAVKPVPTAPVVEALGLDIDLTEWDRTPTETDLPPVDRAGSGTVEAVEAPGAAATIEEAVSMVELVELGQLGATAGDPASAAPPTFLPLGTPGPDAQPQHGPALQLPAFDLPAGLVWPAVSGRGALAQLAPPVHVTTVPVAWAPRQAIELACGERWLAHTAAALWFTDLDEARRMLLETARWQAAMGALTPPGRTYALSPQADGARLWVLTPAHRTVWAAIEEAFERGDRATAGWLARRGLETVDAIRAQGGAIGDLDHIGLDEPPRLLTTPWTAPSDRLTAQLQRLFNEAVL